MGWEFISYSRFHFSLFSSTGRSAAGNPPTTIFKRNMSKRSRKKKTTVPRAADFVENNNYPIDIAKRLQANLHKKKLGLVVGTQLEKPATPTDKQRIYYVSVKKGDGTYHGQFLKIVDVLVPIDEAEIPPEYAKFFKETRPELFGGKAKLSAEEENLLQTLQEWHSLIKINIPDWVDTEVIDDADIDEEADFETLVKQLQTLGNQMDSLQCSFLKRAFVYGRLANAVYNKLRADKGTEGRSWEEWCRNNLRRSHKTVDNYRNTVVHLQDYPLFQYLNIAWGDIRAESSKIQKCLQKDKDEAAFWKQTVDQYQKGLKGKDKEKSKESVGTSDEPSANDQTIADDEETSTSTTG